MSHRHIIVMVGHPNFKVTIKFIWMNVHSKNLLIAYIFASETGLHLQSVIFSSSVCIYTENLLWPPSMSHRHINQNVLVGHLHQSSLPSQICYLFIQTSYLQANRGRKLAKENPECSYKTIFSSLVFVLVGLWRWDNCGKWKNSLY